MSVSGQRIEQSPAVQDLAGRSSDDSSSEATPRLGPEAAAEDQAQANNPNPNKKGKKRSLFGFGKKKDDQAASPSHTRTSHPLSSAAAAPPLHSERSKMSSTTQSTASPTQSEPAFMIPASPVRGLSGSPRLSSPAGSQIFERDVDTMAPLNSQSPAIPSHIQTENHIPPVLDASSEAITDNHLDPDSVEIVTPAQPQPGSNSLAGGSGPGTTQPSLEQLAASWAEELGPSAAAAATDRDHDATSHQGSGSLDNVDVRRLSFISFADVVQAEHSGGPAGSRDSIHLAGMTSLSANRSPSPVRSPVSSQGAPGTSPPTSNPGSVKGIELSPGRKPMGGAGSPVSVSVSASHHTIGGNDVNVETMSQALRRTGSKDFGGVRSSAASPIEGPSH